MAEDNVSEVELALDKDGHFLGLRVKTVAAMGAYLAIRGPRPPTNNLGTLAGIYRTPAVHVAITGCLPTPYRPIPIAVPARRKPTYLGERIIDMAARELNMDPAEIRQKNSVTPDQMPWTNALGFTYDCGDFPGNMEKALDAIDYWLKIVAQEAASRGKLRRLGMSNTVKRPRRRFGSGQRAVRSVGHGDADHGHD